METRKPRRPRLVVGALATIGLLGAVTYGILWFVGEQKRMIHKITTAPPSRPPLHVGDDGARKLGLSVPATPATPFPPATAPLKRKAGLVEIEAKPEFDPAKIARTAVILSGGNASESGKELRNTVTEALKVRGYAIASDTELLPVVETMTARIAQKRLGRAPELLADEVSEVARELVVPAVVFVETSSIYTSGPPPSPIRTHVTVRFIPADSPVPLWEARWSGTARRSSGLHSLHMQGLEMIVGELPYRPGFAPLASPGR
jgi:hypothetical protein